MLRVAVDIEEGALYVQALPLYCLVLRRRLWQMHPTMIMIIMRLLIVYTCSAYMICWTDYSKLYTPSRV